MKPIFALASLSLVLAAPALAHPEPGSAAHHQFAHFLSEPDHVLAIAGGLMLAALLARRLLRANRAKIVRRRAESRRPRHRSD